MYCTLLAGCFRKISPDATVSKEGAGRYSFTSTHGSVVRISENDSGEIIMTCGGISMEKIIDNNHMTKSELKRPDQIKAYLDKYVIGQDEAKKTLSVAVYNHYKRVLHKNDPACKVKLDKSNILLLGETGSGKTLLVKTIAEMLGVPYYIGNATSLSASGYVGDDIESLLSGLLMNSNFNMEAAQTGIIFIDEVDKIAKKDAGMSITRDVSGECVQQGLLKMVEGHIMGVPPMGGRKHPEQPLLRVDTLNILFIISGAFVGLDGIISRRLGKDTGKIGFGTSDVKDTNENILSEVTAQDLREYGMIPEFVGRFPVVTYVDPLTESDLMRILSEPKNSITDQYKELFRQDGFEIEFTDEALSWVAHKAIDLGTGARGLHSIMEKSLRNLMYSMPKMADTGKYGKIVITEEIISGLKSTRTLLSNKATA